MKRILVVDDAGTVRLFHRSVLEAAGYVIEEALNGIEALEKALETPFDLLLVDVNMPKLDGYGFIRQLRSADVPQAPVVMISTESAAGDAKQAYSAGANLYLVKPVRPDVLLASCRLLLGEPCR